MSIYGIKPTGFNPKTETICKQEIDEDISANLSVTIPTSSASNFGKVNQIYAEKFAARWTELRKLYEAFEPENALREAHENVAAITGTVATDPTHSTGTLDRIYLEGGKSIPAGSVVSVGEQGSQFQTLTEVLNEVDYFSVFAVEAESVEFGDIVGFGGTIDTIQTVQSGWGAVGVITSGLATAFSYADGDTLVFEVDGGLPQTITFATADPLLPAPGPLTPAQVAAIINDQISGAFASGNALAASGNLYVASSSEGRGSSMEYISGTGTLPTTLGFATGLVAGMNSEDFTLGIPVPTQEALEIQRQDELGARGRGNVLAIAKRLLAVSGVTHVTVFDNDTEMDDAVRNVRKWSIDVLVRGGSSADVAAALLDAIDTTTNTDGKDVTENVDNAQGETIVVKYSIPSDVDIYFEYTVKIDAETFPSDGETQIKTLIKALMDQSQTDQDVIASIYECIPEEVEGVIAVTAYAIGTAPSPTLQVNIPIALRELAVVSFNDIDITLV